MPLTRENIRKQCEFAQQKTQAIVSFVVPEIQDKGRFKDIRIALKDNISLKGYPLQAGSKILEGYQCPYDAAIVEKIKQEGGCIVAKTAMDELGMGGSGNNDIHGPVIHPWDASRIPGGSSSGCAALVAVDGADVAVGTDTGDSIRKPASYMGLVGLKPTYGRISRFGVVPYASSMDTVGILARSIEQVECVYDVLKGQDERDVMTFLPKSLEKAPQKKQGLLRLAVFDSISEDADPVLKARLQKLIEQLETKQTIKHVQMPQSLLALIDPVYTVIANAEACSNHANLDGLRFGLSSKDQSVENIRSRGFSWEVKKRFLCGAYALHKENQERLFIKAQKIRRKLVDAYASMFTEADIVFSLTTPDVAPLISEYKEDASIGLSYLKLSNFSGYPSISIPFGHKDGLPFGLHLAAKPCREDLLLKAAKMFSQVIQEMDHV